jgi:hypothetical protein
MASEVCAAGSCETGMGSGAGQGEIGIGPDDLRDAQSGQAFRVE